MILIASYFFFVCQILIFNGKLCWYRTKENVLKNLENKNFLFWHFYPGTPTPAPFPLPINDKLKMFFVLHILMQLFAFIQQNSSSEKFCKMEVLLYMLQTFCHGILFNFSNFETAVTLITPDSFFNDIFTQHKKWSFPLRISSVNVTKTVGNWGIGYIYWGNP